MTNEDQEDDIISYADARFEIRPYPKYRDLMRINDLVNQLGYKMPFSMKQYSLEDVQEKLHTEGAQAFLRLRRVQEDISPKAPFKDALTFVAERLALLGPTSDLIIVDPYFFPPKPQLGEDGHAQFVAELIAPLLAPGATVTCVINERANLTVADATRVHLSSLVKGAELRLVQSDDFHDRFWIADRARGAVVGTSFNGLGSKLFLIDELKKSDVASIVEALTALDTWDD